MGDPPPPQRHQMLHRNPRAVLFVRQITDPVRPALVHRVDHRNRQPAKVDWQNAVHPSPCHHDPIDLLLDQSIQMALRQHRILLQRAQED